MKFTTETVNPSATMSDADFVARMCALDDMLDATIESEESLSTPATPAEVLDNMITLECLIDNGCFDKAYLDYYVRNTPGLSDMYGGSVEAFRANLKNAIDEQAACEGKLDGFIGDFATGPVGLAMGPIALIISAMRSKLPNLIEQVKICKEKLANTSDDKIELRSKQKLIRVRSKYLPEYSVFMKACEALTKVLNAIASNPTADQTRFIELLKGSMYYTDKGKLKGNQNTNWKYAMVRLLPVLASTLPRGGDAMYAAAKVSERDWFEPSQPVGKRGWNSRAAYENGLKALESLINALTNAIQKLSANSGSDTKAAALMLKWASKEVIYLGRGLTTAIRKVYAGGFVRFVSNRVIH